MILKLEKLPRSRRRLTISVSAEKLTRHYEEAVKRVGQHLEIKGFRKGKAPRQLVIDRAGNGAILNELFELAITEAYFLDIKEKQASGELLPVERPSIEIKEVKGLSETNLIPTELIFTAEVDVMPSFSVKGYDKVRVKPVAAKTEIEPAEIAKTIEELKKSYGDDYLKVGNFADEAALTAAMSASLKEQRILEAESATYDAIIEALLKRTKVEVPESFIHREIHRLEHQMEMQLKAYGLKFDDWLAREKKTHDDIHTEWRPQAEKSAAVGLILGAIAEEEGIDPQKNEATRQVLEKLYQTATGLAPRTNQAN